MVAEHIEAVQLSEFDIELLLGAPLGYGATYILQLNLDNAWITAARTPPLLGVASVWTSMKPLDCSWNQHLYFWSTARLDFGGGGRFIIVRDVLTVCRWRWYY